MVVAENDVFTVVQCSHGVFCSVQGRLKQFQLKNQHGKFSMGHLILKWFKQCLTIKTYSINKTHATLLTKNIPRVLNNTVEFYNF